MANTETLEKMRAILADSLALEPDEVKAESRIFDDLGADSLDVVDVIFTVKKVFGVEVKLEDLNFVSGLDPSGALAPDGFLSPQAIAKLTPWLAGLAAVQDPSRVTPAQLKSMITVETLCRIVDSKLAAVGPAPR